MNLESVKSGFLSYLTEKLEKEGKDTTSLNLSEASIFAYDSEFKKFLVEECNADSSVFSMSMSEIMSADFSTDNTVPEDIEPVNTVLSDEEITNFLDSVENMEDGDFGFEEETVEENIQTQEPVIIEMPEESENEPANEITNGIIIEDTEIVISEENNNSDLTILDKVETENPQKEKLEEFYSKPEVIEKIDTDGDGILSDEEKTQFEKYLKETNNETEEITDEILSDVLTEIKDGTFKYNPKKDGENTKIDVPKKDKTENKKDKNTTPAPSSSGNGSVPVNSGNDYAPSTDNNSQNSTTTNNTANASNMSLEELEQTKATKSDELSEAQNALSAVYSGDDSDVKEAMEEYDEAEAAYLEAVEDDPVLKEYKEEIEANLKEIDEAQKATDTAEDEVNKCEDAITAQESTISGLKSQLNGAEAAVASYSGVELSDEQKAAQAQAQAEVDRLKTEISKAETELGTLKTEKETAEENLKAAEERLKTAEDKKTELDKIVQEKASETTKAALEEYNAAKENLESVKAAKIASVQVTITSLQNEITQLDAKINEKKQKEVESKYSNSKIEMDVDFEGNLTDAQKSELATIKGIYKDNKEIYEEIAEQVLKDTGISLPAEAICAIHFRESSCNFNTYLHNGQQLGQVTTIVPKGIYFDNFKDAAVDAIEGELDSAYTESCKKYNVKDDCSTMSSVLMFTERYNGFGYRNKGYASAYVYSGTTEYTGGMYVSDGNFSSSSKDPRCGTAIIIKELMNV